MASGLKLATWGLSALLHAALALSLVSFEAGSKSYEAGDGSDVFHVEQGIAVEGLSQAGADAEIIQTAQEQPLEAQAAAEAVPETVPVTEPHPDVVEKSEVITAKADVVEEQEILREQPKEEVKPQVVAAADPIPERLVVEEKTAAAKQSGGDPTIRMAYLGKLRSRIEAKKVNPKSREAGTVLVRFTVDARGQLVSREVASSSGSKLLDDAALAAVERASPYPPFPDGIGAPTIVVNVPFRFMTR
jgi:protein TonB